MAGLVAAIHALLPQAPNRDGERDGLAERVGGGPYLRLRRRGPVAEGEEADVFHGGEGLTVNLASPISCVTMASQCKKVGVGDVCRFYTPVAL